MKRIDIKPGLVYGYLTVIKEVPSEGRRRILCYCSCGATVTPFLADLRFGSTTSCGCKKTELKVNAPTRSYEYHCWRSMHRRCYEPTNHQYYNYGGRGIKVCEEWRSFETFLKDMGPRPPNHSIERLDTNGDYTPDNCVWATPKQQNRNQRRTIFVNYKGLTKPLIEWYEELQLKEKGLKYTTLYSRITKLGWPPERAFNTNSG